MWFFFYTFDVSHLQFVLDISQCVAFENDKKMRVRGEKKIKSVVYLCWFLMWECMWGIWLSFPSHNSESANELTHTSEQRKIYLYNFVILIFFFFFSSLRLTESSAEMMIFSIRVFQFLCLVPLRRFLKTSKITVNNDDTKLKTISAS